MNWILALVIFGVDLVQRGLAVFANADIGIPHLQQALSLYFLMMSVGVLACSYFCDNYNSRTIILCATILGALGIVSLPYTAWGYGLVFGAAAAFMKISPFSASLKLKDGKDALRVSPQAAAKNVGGALFLLVLGTAVATVGWIVSTVVLSFFFVISGIVCYYLVPDDKIEGWKWDIFKQLAKDKVFWITMTYFFLMSGWYYVAVKGFYPEIIKLGFDRTETLSIIGVSFLIAGGLRWVVSWIGDQKVFNYKLRLPLMWGGTFGMGSCMFLTPLYPLVSLALFTFFSSIHTPNYWAYCKEKWGKVYISTVVALAFSFMYLGSGIMYGKWF